jgi:hypothetical protein
MTAPQIQAASRVVKTEGGDDVTLCELPVLQADLQRLEGQAKELQERAASLSSLEQQKLIECGRSLVAAYASSIAPDPIRPLVEAAKPLQQEADEETQAIQAMHDAPHHGLGGILAKATTWNEERKAGSQLAALNAKLEPILVQIARQTTDFQGSDATALHAQAVAAEKEAAEAAGQLDAVSRAATAARDEIQRREQSIEHVGFDALYTAAYLQTYGTPNVQSPLVLKRGEHAAASVPATLARQRTRRQWVGGSSGFSFPIGHTGIRYRVGSYHGHPVEQQYLAHLDTGTLVVTDQRIAFVGQARSSSAPLEKLLHVECYKDAIAVFKEGRENADFYLVAQPQYVLFMINWLLEQRPPQ